MTKLLDQYQAAVLLRISPALLLYFTGHTVKKGDRRKLQVASRKEDIFYFEHDELEDYDSWLRSPWPAEPKRRPHLPQAFKDEIQAEAAGECALCNKNGNSCEAAHITPVAQSKCNHPHHLLWLCANHHTKFDNGSLGPKGASNELIRATKLVVQSARRDFWTHTAEASSVIAALLKVAKDLTAGVRSEPREAEEVEAVGKQLLKLLAKAASRNTNESLKPVLDKITSIAERVNVAQPQQPPETAESLESLGSLEEELMQTAGLKECPLCEGRRWHKYHECPVCDGDGSIPVGQDPDLTPFMDVTCRVCTGSGQHDGETCQACGGEGSMEARIADQIDWGDFRKVPCTLCNGEGQRFGEHCSVCGGEQRVPRYVLDQIDLNDYEEVDCPLCEGSGRLNDDDCPECGGDGCMESRFAHQVDLSGYHMADCIVCEGTGLFYQDTCPACSGEQKLTRRQNEAIDLSNYKLVVCPICNGDGCERCDNGGQLPRYLADRFEDS